MKNIIGIDLGGTNIKGGLIENQSIVNELVFPTMASRGGTVTLNVVKSLITQLKTKETKAIGIGVPSVVDRKRGILYNVQNIKNWDEIHLKSILEEAFKIPVFIDNDANCFAMGERKYGSGKNFENFVGITLGTGVGGGIIQNGALLLDANCGSGEFGEIPYLDSILENYCGSRFFHDENNLSGFETALQAIQGERNAVQKFNMYGKHIAVLIKFIVLTVDPQAIIFGGAISNSFHLFEKSMYSFLQDFPYANSIEKLKILKSDIQNIGILGAGALCP